MERRGRPDPVDAVVAGALAVAAQVEIWAPGLAPGVGSAAGSRLVLTVTALTMTVPLAWRSRWPLAVCLLVIGSGIAQQVLTVPNEGLTSLIAMMLAAYSVGSHPVAARRYAGAAVLVAGTVLIGAGDVFFLGVLLAAAWVAGLLVGGRSRRVRELSTRNTALTREREEAAAQGAAEERARIARELHDVVSHRVSMMVVQAQAADTMIDATPDKAHDAVRAIDQAGRDALVELRALLGLLHSSHANDDRSPQHGVEDVEGLVAEARRAGVDVTVTSTGPVSEVPVTVGAAAYRIVQESITNVVKHADGAPAIVDLSCDGDMLTVSVEDRGRRSGPLVPGHGLAGMRERAEFVGGTFTAGPCETGGFAVRATLPVGSEVS